MSSNITAILNNNIIIDNAFGFEPEIEVPYKWDVVDRFATAGFNYMSLSIATDMTSLSNTLHYLAEVTNHIKLNPEKYVLVEKYDDIQYAKQTGKLAVSYLFQGTNPLEKRLELVDTFAKLGVRSMIVSYNARNAMGDGVIEEVDAGLSRLGKLLIAKMNAAGMLIDLSHTGRKTSLDAIELSEKPVIFSHSNVYQLHPHPRNLTNEQIQAVAATGGMIGINGNGPLIGDDTASIKKFVDHIDYVIQLVGDDHAGLGTDLVYFPEIFDHFMRKNAVVYPSTYAIKSIAQWRSVQPEQLSLIIQELQNRGYEEKSIAKVLGGNYLRVIKNVWKY